MNNGTYSLKLAGAVALATVQAAIAAAQLPVIQPSGTIGALARGIYDAAAINLVSVVDFGRGDITSYVHSSNNGTRVMAALNAIAGVVKFNLVPSGTDATSAGWRIVNSANVVVSTPLNVFPGANTAATMDPASIAEDGTLVQAVLHQGVLMNDARTALEKALAPAVEASTPQLSVAQLITAIDKILATAGLEGFLMADDANFVFQLYVVNSTLPTVAFQDGNLPNIDANSLVGIYNVTQTVASASKSLL